MQNPLKNLRLTLPPEVFRDLKVRLLLLVIFGASIALLVWTINRPRAWDKMLEVENMTSTELDGDIHLRIEAGGSFVVAEIIPEFPLAPPHVGQRITAWGIVRHDGLHTTSREDLDQLEPRVLDVGEHRLPLQVEDQREKHGEQQLRRDDDL